MTKKILSKINLKYNIYWFFLYFAIALVIGIFARDIPGQPEIFINMIDFLDQGAKGSSQGDVFSFAEGAVDIYNTGWIKTENYWLIRLWPPGFMYLEGLILKIFGLRAPFILILIVFNSFFIAGLLLIFRAYLLTILSNTVASILPLVLFCFPVIRFFLLEPGAIILGEGFSIVFFCSAVLLVLLAVKNRSLTQAIFAGVLLAFSAYFRSQFEIIIKFLTIIAICMFLFSFVKKIMQKGFEGVQKEHVVIKTIFFVLITTHITMLPWRIHNNRERKTFSWVYTSYLVYENAGKTDKELSSSAAFILSGGGNLACKLEPTYCGKSSAQAFYRAFFGHIVEWYKHKVSISGAYWFSSLQNYVSIYYPPVFFDFLWNTVYLIFVLITFPLLWCIRRHLDAPILMWICTSFYACFFVIFTFVHFESRYFYTMKIFSVFTFIILGSIAWKMLSTRKENS